MTYANERPPQRDRYILIPVFVLAPAILIWGVLLPAQLRMAQSRSRMDAANAQMESIGQVTPLTSAERAVLDDPNAPWRSRMPLVSNDLDRLNHYAQVVTGIQTSLKSAGSAMTGVRSSWDPIRANFSTPAHLSMPAPGGSSQNLADASVAGWALEIQVAEPTSALGRSLQVLPKVDPLLIPIGLRWEAREGKPFQAIELRNLYLAPPTPPQPPAANGAP